MASAPLCNLDRGDPHRQTLEMDAGLAAVCGALAGSIATIGAAFTAGYWQQQSAQMVVRAEHRRLRGEPRTQVYEDFAKAVASLRIFAVVEPPGPFMNLSAVPMETFTEEFSTSCGEKVKEISTLCLKVELAGPTSVAEIARELETNCNALSLSAKSLCRHRSNIPFGWQASSDEFAAFARQVAHDLGRFTHAARSVLDDDGLSHKHP